MSETLSAEVEAALDTFQRLLEAQPHSMGYAQTQEAATLRTALERSARIEAERDAAHDAIRWALGEGDSDFGDDLHDGAFWWRKPLRDKAGLVWSAGRCRSVTPDELLDRAALNDRED
jgi:hypothetical protein